jgi:hypothetical protein
MELLHAEKGMLKTSADPLIHIKIQGAAIPSFEIRHSSASADYPMPHQNCKLSLLKLETLNLV